MNKAKTYFGSLVLVLVASSFTVLNDWYHFENAYLSLEFPNKPALNLQEVPSSLGKLKMETAFYEPTEDKKDVYLYGLVTSEYPDSLINSGKKDILPAFFRNSIDGTVTDTKGKLLSEKEIAFGAYPGREIKIDYGNGQAIIDMRLYLIKNKMTILQVITPPVIIDSTSKVKFFNSLKLK
jgi:hypothetical protein